MPKHNVGAIVIKPRRLRATRDLTDKLGVTAKQAGDSSPAARHYNAVQ
jgi:hypothetical protein